MIDAFDGLLITGSPLAVYEGHDWIAPLEDLIRQTAAAGKPQVGICFGHQLLSQAFGGRVEKSDKGWGVGVHEYEVKDACGWMTPALAQFNCVVSHQDQVVKAPPGARVLSGSEFCPNGALQYAQGPAISFQPHPEFSHEYADALLRTRQHHIAESVIEIALNSFKDRTDRNTLARWIVQFYKTHGRKT